MRDTGSLTFAVVGATGAVGREMVSILSERGLVVKEPRLFASERSRGEPVEFNGEELRVETLTEDSLEGVDIALFSAGSQISKQYAKRAAARGTVVIDNSSCFRMDEECCLTVPEVNAEELATKLRENEPGSGIVIANPNCSTIQLAVVLKPLADTFGLVRVVVSTYQSVSGAGKRGMDELFEQTRGIYSQNEKASEVFPQQIAFNCIPHIGEFEDEAYATEELKLMRESKKILNLPDLKITATAVRVPVFSSHAESVNVELRSSCSPDQARELLRASPGIIVVDDPKNNLYPQQHEAAGSDVTFVGRVRRDDTVEHGLNMWIVADNLRKGAALNAVQIAEVVIDAWGREAMH